MYEASTEIIEMCTKPSHWFAPSDKPEDWERWGPTFSKNRDSDVLQTSNYETIKEDMLLRFPDDTMIIPSGHWLVGWIEELWVRHYDDNGPTAAHEAIMDWKAELEGYPIADEEDFSRREYEEQIDYLTSYFSVDEEQAVKIHRWLSHNDYYWITESSGSWIEDSRIKEAIKAMGFEDED